MRIIIVEDDYLQADTIRDELMKELKQVKIERISTESNFRSRIQEIELDPPDVIIIDIMLRWTDPSPEMQVPPEDVLREGPYRAGFRCQRLLAEHDNTKNIPVILYSILEQNDLKHELEGLPQNVIHLVKQTDMGPLIHLIRRITGIRP